MVALKYIPRRSSTNTSNDLYMPGDSTGVHGRGAGFVKIWRVSTGLAHDLYSGELALKAGGKSSRLVGMAGEER